MADSKQQPVGPLCKYCNNRVVSGPKCITCGSAMHPSCAKRLKSVKKIDVNSLLCCEKSNNIEDLTDEQEDNLNSELTAGNGNLVQESEHLKRENFLLEQLLSSKDAIISELKEEISLLKNNISLLQEIKLVKYKKVHESDKVDLKDKVTQIKKSTEIDNKNINKQNNVNKQ